MVDNNLLEYLAVFIENGSLLKASEALHVSQPSMSKAMQKLENQLGIPIFDRKANKISLNDNGKKLLPYIVKPRRKMRQRQQVKDGRRFI